MLLHTTLRGFGPKPFRFENMWVNQPSFKVFVDKWWKECEVGGWGGFVLMKLGYFKRKLLKWNKSTLIEFERNFKRLIVGWKMRIWEMKSWWAEERKFLIKWSKFSRYKRFFSIRRLNVNGLKKGMQIPVSFLRLPMEGKEKT